MTDEIESGKYTPYPYGIKWRIPKYKCHKCNEIFEYEVSCCSYCYGKWVIENFPVEDISDVT